MPSLEPIDPPMPLDPGIKRYVDILRAEGIDTFESCEGGAGHASPEPIIRFHGDQSEGFKAFAVARQHGLPVFKVGLVYRNTDGWLTGPWWEMVFATKDQG